MGQTKKHEEEEDETEQRVGAVSSERRTCNDGHVANQEGTLGEDAVMCAGEWL